MIEPRTPDSVKVIQVIETKCIRGKGTDDDPGRIVTQLWSFDGKLLADDDVHYLHLEMKEWERASDIGYKGFIANK